MNLKAVFSFLFLTVLINSFSISMTPFPLNMTAGGVYDSQLTITTLGQTWTTFYLHLGGVNASNEIEASLDGGACDYSDQTWICTYNQSVSGVYAPKLHLKMNELLDPSGIYSYSLDYKAIEDTPIAASAPSRSYYSSSGGSSFPPRAYPKLSPPAPVKNDTPTPPKPTAQNTTITPVVPPNQTINQTAQNETDPHIVSFPNVTIQPIQIVEAAPEKPLEYYLLPVIAIGLFAVGVVVFGAYLIREAMR